MSAISRRLFVRNTAFLTVLSPLLSKLPAFAGDFPQRQLSHTEMLAMGLFERDRDLRLFRRPIHDLVTACAPVALDVDAGWRRQWIQRYVEDFLLQFGCLPSGRHRVEVFWGQFYDGGVVRFEPSENVFTKVRPIAANPISPKLRQRARMLRHYDRHIDVLAASIPDRHLKYGWGWHRIWTRRYIGDHLLKFGELPVGKMAFSTEGGSRYSASAHFRPIDELLALWPIYDLENEERVWHPDRYPIR
ncbi:hypothetical protein R0135_14295 [Congregibacter variabilis]|uniref:Uncharacterized protein n=1 Tax=Congregibacter variabilis TaxID=3081200 RepID=A0ABZ0I1B3_9GAMM|nr:hypothetical protein R0135_14295 [Congregibacter sp. IMCC43200]